MAGETAGDLRKVLSYQWLPAGKAHLVYTQADEDPDQIHDFRRAQVGVARLERNAFVRHAIGAAQVAALGQRYPQVVVAPAVAVDQNSRFIAL